MRFLAFQNTFRDFTVFSTYDIEKAFPGFDSKVLVAWQKKGHIQKIRNNWYGFSGRLYREDDLFLIANKIYAPSYISLESALSHYQFIPEGVFRITSVGTQKTTHFDSPIGYFHYQNIKPALFWGYRLEKQLNSPLTGWYKIAGPEKAVIDFLYLNPQYKTELDFEGLRFNWEEFGAKVNLDKLENCLEYIRSKALSKRMKKLLNLFYAQS